MIKRVLVMVNTSSRKATLKDDVPTQCLLHTTALADPGACESPTSRPVPPLDPLYRHGAWTSSVA